MRKLTLRSPIDNFIRTKKNDSVRKRTHTARLIIIHLAVLTAMTVIGLRSFFCTPSHCVQVIGASEPIESGGRTLCEQEKLYVSKSQESV